MNIGILDRLIRFTFGVAFIAWAIAGGPFWTWIGLLFLATGAWGRSPLYTFLGISTR